MSADNWATCPNCMAVAEAARAGLQEEVRHAYGKVPVDEFDEFDELRARADVPVDPDGFRTFREDYEFYGAEEGTVHVRYSGHCSVCRTGLDISTEYPIELKG